jgi:glucosamine kinase
MQEPLFLGVDGGGTRCRARLCTVRDEILGEGEAGPANIRLGLQDSLSAVLDATLQSLTVAGLGRGDLGRIIACLALAGATEPGDLASAQRHPHPFRRTLITADVHAACVGAHRGRDGAVVVAGTGSVGWAEQGGRQFRVGGWGFPISDEGSGAWLGLEAIRRTLWAHDGRIAWTGLLTAVFDRFEREPHALVRFMSSATSKDYAELAPLIVTHATNGDPAGGELMRLAAGHIEALIARLIAIDAPRLALVGGLAPHIAPWLSVRTAERLVPAAGDALDGALWLARSLTDVRNPAA